MTSRHQLTELWAEVSHLLSGARQLLPATSSSEEARAALTQFAAYLDHNELELAWDALAEAADLESPSRGFWDLLAHAAGRMGLEKHPQHALNKLKGAP